MKSRRASRTLLAIIIALLGWATILALCLLASDFLFGTTILLPPRAWKYEPVTEMAHSRVHVGDERQSAVRALSDAWFHTECIYPGSTAKDLFVDDLFFYGAHDPDKVEIVLVSSKTVDGRTQVDFVGRVESYMLHLYEYCNPPPSQAFDQGTPGAMP